ncbi:macrosialin isoform X2 [Tamandua tetradactyla]|uniref:macrosialin isoform X2 n=1 Tax=Tamandua tetradactyla TaxID=48850 RepID=UPI004053A3A7
MRLVVLFGALLGLLAAHEAGNDCPHKKSATLLPSFTVTPTATASTASPGTTSHKTTRSHRTSTTTGTSSHGPTTATHIPASTSHGNATVHPSNSTTTSLGTSTSSPHPEPPPPSPSPRPGSTEAVGDYTWPNGSQPCVRLQAQIQIRVLYPTQDGGEEPTQSAVYLNSMAVEYNVSFPRAIQWTFSAQNSSLGDLQVPLGQSFSCRNASITLSPAFHVDLLSLQLQAAQLPPSGVFGPSFPCPDDRSFSLPLIIGLILLGLLTLVFAAFCIARRRPSTYQPL